MTATLGWSAYIDVPAYLRAATNQETASLLGLNTTIAGGGTLPAGATTLPVASSAGWAAGPLWLLDGPFSEVAQVVAAPDGSRRPMGHTSPWPRRERSGRTRRASAPARRGPPGRWPRSFCAPVGGSRTTANRAALRVTARSTPSAGRSVGARRVCARRWTAMACWRCGPATSPCRA